MQLVSAECLFLIRAWNPIQWDQHQCNSLLNICVNNWPGTTTGGVSSCSAILFWVWYSNPAPLSGNALLTGLHHQLQSLLGISEDKNRIFYKLKEFFRKRKLSVLAVTQNQTQHLTIKSKPTVAGVHHRWFAFLFVFVGKLPLRRRAACMCRCPSSCLQSWIAKPLSLWNVARRKYRPRDAVELNYKMGRYICTRCWPANPI